MSMRDRIPFCPHGSIDSIDLHLSIVIGKIENHLGYELEFSSGFRCKECNARASGAKNSAHLRGLAVDVLIGNSSERDQIIEASYIFRIRRRGIGRNMIHLDIDTSLPQDKLWLY